MKAFVVGISCLANWFAFFLCMYIYKTYFFTSQLIMRCFFYSFCMIPIFISSSKGLIHQYDMWKAYDVYEQSSKLINSMLYLLILHIMIFNFCFFFFKFSLFINVIIVCYMVLSYIMFIQCTLTYILLKKTNITNILHLSSSLLSYLFSIFFSNIHIYLHISFT